MEHHDEYITLVHKMLSGDITPEEQQQLDQHTLESEARAQLRAELSWIWRHVELPAPTELPNPEQAYRRFRQKAGIKKNTRLLPIVARIAALLTAIGVATWLYLGSVNEQIMTHRALKDRERIQLNDSTVIWLRQGTRLDYHPDHRHVAVRGTAYFDVAPNPGHPFSVILEGGGRVVVLGTEFEVRAPQTNTGSAVVVREGSVQFMPGASNRPVTIKAGQKATFDPKMQQVRIVSLPTMNELAWQKGGMEFIAVPLEVAIRDLEAHYQVKINLGNKSLRGCPFTAPRINQPIAEVLSTLAVAYQMDLRTITADSFLLSGGHCH